MKPPYSKSQWLRQKEIEAQNESIRRIGVGILLGIGSATVLIAFITAFAVRS